ncbi:hypothetical protein IV102_37200 [bacterium]|nr:hypothetical protein [bacterium]
MNPSTTQDAATAARIRDEWSKVSAALKSFSGDTLEDPLGEDGQLTVKLKYFKATGGGEVLFVKGAAPADHRYTRFRAWGATGTDFIEKSSYLVKANGVTEFHKRRVENGDHVVTVHEMEGEDQAWASALQ